jgi:hypothetical protein
MHVQVLPSLHACRLQFRSRLFLLCYVAKQRNNDSQSWEQSIQITNRRSPILTNHRRQTLTVLCPICDDFQTLLMSFQKEFNPQTSVKVSYHKTFYAEVLVNLAANRQAERLSLLAFCDCLFNILRGSLHSLKSPPSATRGRAMPWWQGTHMTACGLFVCLFQCLQLLYDFALFLCNSLLSTIVLR